MTLGLPITAEGVDAISRLDDPVLRNLWITTAYHDFARRLAPYLGCDATWCAFAVWASKSAGASIRGDELPNALKELLADSPQYHQSVAHAQRRTGWLERLGIARTIGHLHVVNVVGDASDRVSGSIADGNLLVFAELAPIFLAICTHLEGGGSRQRDAVIAVVDRVLDARPDRGGPDRAGIETAFAYYAAAFDETDDDTRAELVLAGNIAAVAHEQQRLQDYIERALDAALDVALPDLVLDCTPHALQGAVRWLTRRPLELLAAALNDLWDTAATDLLMRFETADEHLHLARDIPPLADGTWYPAALVELDNDEVRVLWAQWRRDDSAAARDWEQLEVRMNFIVHLFRSRQQHPPLLHAPFSDEQLVVMARGEVPEGPL